IQVAWEKTRCSFGSEDAAGKSGEGIEANAHERYFEMEIEHVKELLPILY
ncbi:hypothetical protein CEXT_269201, partial [Caerostris extrusa]